MTDIRPSNRLCARTRVILKDDGTAMALSGSVGRKQNIVLVWLGTWRLFLDHGAKRR